LAAVNRAVAAHYDELDDLERRRARAIAKGRNHSALDERIEMLAARIEGESYMLDALQGSKPSDPLAVIKKERESLRKLRQGNGTPPGDAAAVLHASDRLAGMQVVARMLDASEDSGQPRARSRNILRRATQRQAQRDRTWQEAAALLDHARDLSSEQKRVIRMRWLEQAETYDRTWRDLRLGHYALRVPIIAGAATVPALAGLAVPRIWTALVGLGVAVLTGFDSFFQFGVRWQLLRKAANAMVSEGWEFVELTGPYSKYTAHSDGFKVFCGRLEALNEHLQANYLDTFRGDGSSAREQITVGKKQDGSEQEEAGAKAAGNHKGQAEPVGAS
jgi:hypothetical protein